MDDYRNIVGLLDGRQPRQGWFRAKCPAHEDDHASLSVKIGRRGNLLMRCHAGAACSLDAILQALSLRAGRTIGKSDLFADGGRRRPKEAQPVDIVATYDYVDENRTLLFQVCRKEPKGFFQRRPGAGEGKWINNTEKVRKVLYRLPELVANAALPVESRRLVVVCYSPDTEILTPDGWLPFPALATAHKVAAYDPETSGIRFEVPKAIQQFPYSGKLVNVKAEWCDLAVTPDHRMLARRQRCQTKIIPASSLGANLQLPVAGWLNYGLMEDGPTELQARLMVSFAADGSWEKRGDQVSWNFKKERKKRRLAMLLTEAGIPYTAHVYDSCREWTSFRVFKRDVEFFERHLPDKRFSWDMLFWSDEAREAALEEIGHWDGDFTGFSGRRFFTSDHRNAEIIQAVAALTGQGSIQRKQERPDRENHNPEYILSLNARDWRTFVHAPQTAEYSGNVHCCTVSTGFIVVRRNGKVTISGNCEGEKDADNLATIGMISTTNPGGAGKWHLVDASVLAGCHVSVIPDKDAPGKDNIRPGSAHAEQVATLLYGKASSVRICRLPQDMPDGTDVSDWLAKIEDQCKGEDVRKQMRDRLIAEVLQFGQVWVPPVANGDPAASAPAPASAATAPVGAPVGTAPVQSGTPANQPDARHEAVKAFLQLAGRSMAAGRESCPSPIHNRAELHGMLEMEWWKVCEAHAHKKRGDDETYKKALVEFVGMAMRGHVDVWGPK